MKTAITLVIAWGEMEPLGMRFAGNLRHAREIAEELEKEYPGTRRMSYVREIDCWFLPGPGSLEEVPQPPPFHTILPEEGWEAEWITERRAVEPFDDDSLTDPAQLKSFDVPGDHDPFDDLYQLP